MMDLELPSTSKQGGNLSLLTMNISFAAENSDGVTAAPAFSQPTAAWS